jgi:hypothetical protein
MEHRLVMPVSIKGSGGGSVTLTSGAAATDTTLTLPNATGTVLTSGTTVTVAQGGTGAATLAANNVLLGNGTSALQVVAPGTNGNVLTSNGTTWQSAAAPSSGVTSLIAGTGISVSQATGAVTVSTSLPAALAVGSYCIAYYGGFLAVGSTIAGGSLLTYGSNDSSGTALTGTWRCMGNSIADSVYGTLWLRIS